MGERRAHCNRAGGAAGFAKHAALASPSLVSVRWTGGPAAVDGAAVGALRREIFAGLDSIALRIRAGGAWSPGRRRRTRLAAAGGGSRRSLARALRRAFCRLAKRERCRCR